MKTLSEFNSEQAFGYDFKESRLKKCIKLISDIPIGAMLDVGCTKGDWGMFWQNRGWKVSGVDVNPDNVSASKSAGLDAILCDCNSERLPFKDQSFDLIFAGEVIEHLIDTDGFIADIYRCLAPGGRAIITTPNLASFENRMRLLLGIYPIWVDYSLKGSGHVRAYTPNILKKQLIQHGFTIRKHLGNWVPFIPQKYAHDIRYPWLSVTGDVFPSLSMDTMILVERPNLKVVY
jgi:SAM-dependent methyltransferase